MIFSISSFAGNTNAQKSIHDLSKDMASINNHLLKLQKKEGMAQFPNSIKYIKSQQLDSINVIFEETIEGVLKELNVLKKKYDSDPYITISGFDINIGLSPSVTVKLDFKHH